MVIDDTRTICINGHDWEDVTNVTAGGMVYSLQQIKENDGLAPEWDTNY